MLPQCSTKFKDVPGLGEALAKVPALEQMRDIILDLPRCAITDVSGIGQMLACMPSLEQMTLIMHGNTSLSNVAGLGKWVAEGPAHSKQMRMLLVSTCLYYCVIVFFGICFHWSVSGCIA